MKNFLEVREAPGVEPAPPAVYGYRPYILSFSAAWVLILTSSYREIPS